MSLGLRVKKSMIYRMIVRNWMAVHWRRGWKSMICLMIAKTDGISSTIVLQGLRVTRLHGVLRLIRDRARDMAEKNYFSRENCFPTSVVL